MNEPGLGVAFAPGDVSTNQIEAQIADLQAQITDLANSAGGNTLFSGLDDVVTPGPNPAKRGIGLYVPDGAGHLTLIPRAVWKDDTLMDAWIAAVDDAAPLAIVNTSLPSGVVGTVYPTTTLTGAHGLPIFAWSVSTSGDALPAGLALTSNVDGTATLAGTPTLQKVSNIILHLQDGLGSYVEVAFSITIAANGGSLAITAPTFANGIVGAALSGVDVSGLVTNAVGAVVFASYSNAPVTAVAMNNAGDTLTWSGGVASIANGTVVALDGITGTPGVVNGPATTYVTMSSGARTVQLALAGTPTTAIVFTADLTGLTINFPSLPLHKLRISTAGVVDSSAAFISTDAGIRSFWISVTDSAANRVYAHVSINITNSGAGPTVTTTTAPSGKINTLYASTTFAATDTDAGANISAGWIISPNGVALPAGMAFSTAGVLNGTPTVSGAFAIVVRCTDATSALYDEQAISLSIAAASVPMTFVPDPVLTAANVGAAYSYAASTKVQNAASTVVYDTYNNAPVSAATSTIAAAGILTWSGGAASIPSGTVVALGGVAATTGIANGPDTTYVAINNGARSIKLALASAPTTAIAFTGTAQAANITINFPTLPTHGVHLDSSAGTVSGLATALVQGTINFTLNAFDGTTRVQNACSLTINGGAQQDINLISTVTWGPGLTPTAAQNNTKAIRAAAEAMRTATGGQGYLWSSKTDTLELSQVNNSYVTSGSSSAPGLNKWYLGNVTFRLRNGEDASNGQYTTFSIQFATAPEVQMTVDGNALNQVQFSTSNTGPKVGFQNTGIELIDCNPAKLGTATQPLTLLNHRGMTGSSLAGITIASVHYAATECFGINVRRSHGGGDTGYIHVESNDGLNVNAGVDARASGAVFQNTVVKSDGSFDLTSVVVTAVNQRHGGGCFAGGRLQFLPGSSATGCEHGFNCEAGVPAHTDNRVTAQVIFGNPSAPSPGDILTSNCTSIGIQYNGASGGIGQFDVYGWDSTNDGGSASNDGAFSATGAAPASGGTIQLHAAVLHNPSYADNFASACAAKASLVGACRALSAGHIHNGSAPATGTWATV